MLRWLERMSGQLPPRLKAILNLAISVALFALAVPWLWTGVSERAWADLATGVGLALLGVFNLFT